MDAVKRPRADDLLVLLAVARTGRYTSAAAHLGLDHTTVARRIAALEDVLGGRVVAQSATGWELTDLGRSAAETGGRIEAALSQLDGGTEPPDPISGVVRMSATDGFSAYIAAPAVAALRRDHPRLTVEIVAATRRAAEHRAGLDLEVVVGVPQTRRAHAVKLGTYTLGMYASRDYLDRVGTPSTAAELEQHQLVYFVDSMLQVDALDLPRRLVPRMQDGLTSTNVFVHVEATRAGAGIGLLPCFAADRHHDLVRLLPSVFAEKLPYYLVARPESLRLPAVSALAAALRAQTRASRAMLDGASD
ncbi:MULTISPECIES: LysR family transcriptional regulator [Microbacterium]|uniref:LysR family transcriptional regulator n=1 Tax=Microbacterium TaxID=33882 RepID=UPI0004939DF7|nr:MULTISPECIES: LysR family transcriptional regulator [Microbacterium]MCV0334975.1 LysR family transcriptional regulator [Microbacterium sp.]MCV0376628.1 LysR family transcriptional regulator [Microbacterium sp.]MCV0391057.1 LysR family transcriptional regulator [Microbacterium sp.]MCV0420199.1 LysR family transcriptional regulator [Microbacterium sp.]MCV0422897.1 LysR family transcriptional regulator [Microbacterium sp.]